MFYDKKYVHHRLENYRNALESVKELAAVHGGPAVIEEFGEIPFEPVSKEENLRLNEEQQKLAVEFQSAAGALMNEYVKGDERSFTIIAFPVPEIGENFETIFDGEMCIRDRLMYQFSARKVKLFQTCMFVPYFISWVVASYVVYALLCPDMGVMSVLCKKLGFSVPNFYNTPHYWRIIMPLAYLWKNVGYMTLLYYATLLGMDIHLLEAAAIDGATKKQRTWYIMLPFLKPTIVLMVLLQTCLLYTSRCV